MSGEFGASIPSTKIPLAQWVQAMRMYLRDYAELNRLTQGQEHSDRLIILATYDTIDDFNTTVAPFSSYNFEQFPSKSVLRQGTTVFLLESLGLLMTRNHLNFSDGGVQVGVSDKTPLIQSWIQLLKNSYEEKKANLKKMINIEMGWGSGLSSEYLWTNGFYGGW